MNPGRNPIDIKREREREKKTKTLIKEGRIESNLYLLIVINFDCEKTNV